jgi:hypothetical protein
VRGCGARGEAAPLPEFVRAGPVQGAAAGRLDAGGDVSAGAVSGRGQFEADGDGVDEGVGELVDAAGVGSSSP